MRIRLLVAAVVLTAGSIGVSTPHASADAALTISAPVSTVLGSGAPGTTISGAIGPVTVTDDRALLSASWTATAAETVFSNGAQSIPATDASYTPGSITTTGTITATPTDVTLTNSPQTVVTGSAGVGNNTATWNPTVAVSVPADAVAGTYTGTLTHAVGDTTTTTATTTISFTVTSGALSLSAPVSANLGSGAPGTTISAAIGPVTVTDDRALASASWTVTAAETDFSSGGNTIPATAASYTPGTITTTGTITATPTNVTLTNSAQTVVTGSAGVGDNTATWNPTVPVAVPANAVAGTYTGTLAHSVDPDTTITFTVLPTTTTTVSAPGSDQAGTPIPSGAIAATLSGAASGATGTISFTVFGPQAAAPTVCTSGGTAVGSGTSVSGNGTYHPSAGFTPSTAGTYWWYASYSGDSGNVGSNSGCGAGMTSTLVFTCGNGGSGNVTVPSSGITCVSGGGVTGNVTVPAGGSLVLMNATVGGNLNANGARTVTICGSHIGGSISVTNSTGPVVIGDGGDAGSPSCAGNTVGSGVTVTGNTANAELAGNHIQSSVTFNNNAGTAPGIETSPEVEGNTIGANLKCSGNSSLSNDGQPNAVAGNRTGQCVGL